jgi:hypothetical protein
MRRLLASLMLALSVLSELAMQTADHIPGFREGDYTIHVFAQEMANGTFAAGLTLLHDQGVDYVREQTYRGIEYKPTASEAIEVARTYALDLVRGQAAGLRV